MSPPTAERPAATVIVPVRNGARTLGRCLDGLAAQADGATFEVVVVDNASTDASAAIARAHKLVDLVVREERAGSYAARNAGIAVATAPVLAFLDADCMPRPGWLAAGLAALAEGLDAVGGRIAPRPSAAPSAWERYDRALYLDQRRLVAEQGFAATANLLVRAAVVQALGGFDATLRSSGDLEFGHRLSAGGYRLGYAPAAVVEHEPRRTAAGTWRLHRRLGAGWAALARRGLRPRGLRDPALWLPLGAVVDAVAADGPPLRRRRLAPVHALATLARVTGRLTGRG